MNSPTRDVGMLAIAIAIVIVAFMGLLRVDNALKVRAVSECTRAASSTQADGGFNGGVYKICVEDSGYKTQIQ